MKVKFNDLGRCLVCLKNPCQCKKIIKEKIRLSDDELYAEIGEAILQKEKNNANTSK